MGEPTVVIEQNVPVPMHDGVILRTDVYRPAAAGQYPAAIAYCVADYSTLKNRSPAQ